MSIMYMAPELDAGDVIRAAKTAIDPEEDAQALTARLAELGAQALAETVEDIAAARPRARRRTTRSRPTRRC